MFAFPLGKEVFSSGLKKAFAYKQSPFWLKPAWLKATGSELIISHFSFFKSKQCLSHCTFLLLMLPALETEKNHFFSFMNTISYSLN